MNKIGRLFNSLSERRGIKQKDLAEAAHISKQSMNGYCNGGNVPLDIGMTISRTVGDDQYRAELASEILGGLPYFNGDGFESSSVALQVISDKEQRERMALKDKAMYLMTKRDGKLTDSDRATLDDYRNEFEDEVLVELSLLITIANKLGTTTLKSREARKVQWTREGYIKNY